MCQVRRAEPAVRKLLPRLRGTARARRSCAAFGAEGRHGPVLRRRGLDAPRRATRSRIAAPRHVALVRGDERRAASARRRSREVHRRRGHGRVRRPAPERGRCAPCGARRGRDAPGAGAPERGARARLERDDPDPNGNQHRRGGRRRSVGGPYVRHGRRGQRRQAARAGGATERDPARRRNPKARGQRGRRRAARPADGQGQARGRALARPAGRRFRRGRGQSQPGRCSP